MLCAGKFVVVLYEMAYSSDEGLSGLTQNIFSEQISMPDFDFLSEILHTEETWHVGNC